LLTQCFAKQNRSRAFQADHSRVVSLSDLRFPALPDIYRKAQESVFFGERIKFCGVLDFS